jgi:hypothetical protein
MPKTYSIFTLHVELKGITPPIWRDLVVGGDISLAKLHHYLQAAMGWTDSHLHAFYLNDKMYGDLKQDPDGELEMLDERKIILKRHLEQGSEFIYQYDFGDNWKHRIVVTNVIDDAAEPLGVACVEKGQRACPPEDVGGSGEYQQFIECIQNDRNSEESKQLLEWAGNDFNPDLFDRHAANAALLRMAWNRWGGR